MVDQSRFEPVRHAAVGSAQAVRGQSPSVFGPGISPRDDDALRCRHVALLSESQASASVAPSSPDRSQASRASWMNRSIGMGGRPVTRSTSSERPAARPRRAAA